MKRLTTIAATLLACVLTVPCSAENNKLLLGLSYRQIDAPTFNNNTFNSDEMLLSAQELDLLEGLNSEGIVGPFRFKDDSFQPLSWQGAVSLAIQRLNWSELGWDQWDPRIATIDLEAVDAESELDAPLPAYQRLLGKFENEGEREFLDKVYTNNEIRRVAFIGIHRYWIRPARRMLFEKVMGPDREAYMDRDSMPGRAASEYRQQILDMGWDQQFDRTNVRTPWNSKTRGRVEVYGRRENYAEWGPVYINNRGRLRVDLTELTGLNRWLSSVYLRSRSRRRRGGGASPDITDTSFVRVGGDHARLLRFRMNLSGSMSTSSGLSSVSFRVRTVWAPTRKRSATLPITMRIKYDLDDGDIKTSFRVRLLSF